MVDTRNFPLDDVMTSVIVLRVGLTLSVKLAIAEFMNSNIPSSPAHGVFISQLIRYAGLAPLMNVLFWIRRDLHVSFSGRDMSGNVWNRPSWSSVVNMGISSNIIKSPSPRCYMTLWDMIIYIQWHPPLIRHFTKSWPCYRTGPYYRFWRYYLIPGGFHRTLQRVQLANRWRLLLRTPGPVPFALWDLQLF